MTLISAPEPAHTSGHTDTAAAACPWPVGTVLESRGDSGIFRWIFEHSQPGVWYEVGKEQRHDWKYVASFPNLVELIPATPPVSGEDTAGSGVDLDAIAREWLTQCGPHDYGMPEYGCNCPSGDPRPVISKLVYEVKRLRAELAEASLDADLNLGAYEDAVDGALGIVHEDIQLREELAGLRAERNKLARECADLRDDADAARRERDQQADICAEHSMDNAMLQVRTEDLEAKLLQADEDLRASVASGNAALDERDEAQARIKDLKRQLDNTRTYLDQAKSILDYAMHLRMYGERAPGGNETWREFDKRAETFLRSLAGGDDRD